MDKNEEESVLSEGSFMFAGGLMAASPFPKPRVAEPGRHKRPFRHTPTAKPCEGTRLAEVPRGIA